MGSSHDRVNLDTVYLVGLGNIGFRHLQGLIGIAQNSRVIGVDPMEEARQRASTEWLRAVGTELETQADLDKVSPDCSVAILATCAANRLELLKKLVENASPQFIILEKVAFPKLSDFEAANTAALQAKADVFVNCPRRLWRIYNELMHLELGDAPDFALTVRWRHLGLACNGVHFVDLLQYLTGAQLVQLASVKLDRIVPAKRAGYFEVSGTVGFHSQTGGALTIDVSDAAPESMEITLRANGLEYRIDEAAGTVETPDGTQLIQAGRMPYQSELTGDLVKSLLKGRSKLASLHESQAAHAPLFEALTPLFAQAGIETSSGLPIT